MKIIQLRTSWYQDFPGLYRPGYERTRQTTKKPGVWANCDPLQTVEKRRRSDRSTFEHCHLLILLMVFFSHGFAAKTIRPHELCFRIPVVYKSARSIGAGRRGHRLDREGIMMGVLAFSSDVIDCNVSRNCSSWLGSSVGNCHWRLHLGRFVSLMPRQSG